MNQSDLLASIEKYWEEKIIPTLTTYIEIPAKSPAFDVNWKKSGHLDRVLKLVDKWIDDRKVPGLKKEILLEGDRTPLLLLEIPGDMDYQVLMYGHLAK